MTMWTDVQFWKDASWRAFRSACQCLAALLSGNAVNILTIPWGSMLPTAATAGLVSLLMSVDRGRAVAESATGLSAPAVPAAGVTETTVTACGDTLK